jgi:hypothetical protein
MARSWTGRRRWRTRKARDQRVDVTLARADRAVCAQIVWTPLHVSDDVWWPPGIDVTLATGYYKEPLGETSSQSSVAP